MSPILTRTALGSEPAITGKTYTGDAAQGGIKDPKPDQKELV